MQKATFQASSDVALVKYWGKKDEALRLPENGSVSMSLSGLETVTTVDFDEKHKNDEVIINGKSDKIESERAIKHLDRIRSLAGVKIKAKVVSENNFPKGTGLSSSGSGLAALTMAGTEALSMKLSKKELSILARQGSGTACRCVRGGFVEWKDGNTSESSYSETIYPAKHWDIRSVIAVVDEGKKKVSSTMGHKSARSSVFFEERQGRIGKKIEKIKKHIKEKEFSSFGQLVEAEALEFHSILLTSNPPLVAWYPGTIEVINKVYELRKKGVECYFTINTGFNVHVLTLPKNEGKVREEMEKLPMVKKVLLAKAGDGPKELKKHLF